MDDTYFLMALKSRPNDGALVGRLEQLHQMEGCFAAGYRILFVIEEQPGAGGMRIIREHAARCRSFGNQIHIVNSQRMLAAGYPASIALSNVFNEIPDDFSGLLVLRDLRALFSTDMGFEMRPGKISGTLAAALVTVVERCPGMRIIVCCTATESSSLMDDSPLDYQAARIDVPALGWQETLEILKSQCLLRWPMITISSRAQRTAVSLGAQDPALALPGAAVALMSRTVAHKLAQGSSAVRAADIEATASKQSDLARPPGRSTLIRPEHGLERVILPEELIGQIQDLLTTTRARSRLLDWGFRRDILGHASAALFFGPPGTGKTLAAEAIAHDLGRPLCRVDAAGATSKWIGESEKMIQDLFRFASKQSSVLLIDEADAMLGRRVAIDHGSDRWANSVVDQLLQEIDRFEGVVILTTNVEHQLDPALQRRLAYRLCFPMPDADARERIWRAHLPDRAPVSPTVDLHVLAREFELSGGLIRNAVVRAAVKAASSRDQRDISMAMLREAARAQQDEKNHQKLAGFRVPQPRDAAHHLKLAAAADGRRCSPISVGGSESAPKS